MRGSPAERAQRRAVGADLLERLRGGRARAGRLGPISSSSSNSGTDSGARALALLTELAKLDVDVETVIRCFVDADPTPRATLLALCGISLGLLQRLEEQVPDFDVDVFLARMGMRLNRVRPTLEDRASRLGES